MATRVQQRRGTTSEHASFTGAAGEITVDTTKKTAVVHDGTTAGGVPLAKESALSSYLTTTAAGSTYQPLSGMSSYLTTASAASTYLVSSAIGTTVQSYDANTAKTNIAQTYTAGQRGTIVTLTDAATITPDLANGNHFTVTLGGNRTLANPTYLGSANGQSGVIVVKQDATAGRTLAFGSNWKFPGGSVPSLTTSADAVDLLAYHVESATCIAVRFIGDVK